MDLARKSDYVKKRVFVKKTCLNTFFNTSDFEKKKFENKFNIGGGGSGRLSNLSPRCARRESAKNRFLFRRVRKKLSLIRQEIRNQ